MKAKSKKMPGGLCMAAALLAAHAVLAANDEAIIQYRQELMVSNGAKMGAIGDSLKYKLPYQKDMAGHARAISLTARMIAGAFKTKVTEGTTDAQPDIGSGWDEFEEYADKLGKASDEPVKTADAGDVKALGAAVKELGGACKKCHDDCRKPKEESCKNRE